MGKYGNLIFGGGDGNCDKIGAFPFFPPHLLSLSQFPPAPFISSEILFVFNMEKGELQKSLCFRGYTHNSERTIMTWEIEMVFPIRIKELYLTRQLVAATLPKDISDSFKCKLYRIILNTRFCTSFH